MRKAIAAIIVSVLVFSGMALAQESDHSRTMQECQEHCKSTQEPR